MAISIGNVWDSTTDLLASRGRLLAPVAALAFLLPAAVQGAVTSYGGISPGAAMLSALVGLVGVVAALWGSLSVIAIASDPGATVAGASAVAVRRLGPALLVSLVLGVAMMVAVLPIVVVLYAAGFDFQAAAGGSGSAGQAQVGPGTALFCLFYGLLLFVALLWIAARLVLLSPVILHERRGIGAIGRSVVLTRGLTLKLIGALLLAITWGVAALAARYVVFIPLRLALGADNLPTATWLGDIAAAIVGAVVSTAVAVFSARLYLAVAPRLDA